MAYALLSVFDKTGIVEFGRALEKAGLELISTGGTYRVLSEAGLSVRQVSEVTGSPEILDGRVKTLHPAVHGGLLARRSRPDDLAELAEHGIQQIDVVAGNLYPFSETIANPAVALEEALENIDIGGPTMIRAAAKNFPDVVVVVDPDDYSRVAEMVVDGGVPLEQRRELAARAFQHVALYDTVISGYLRDGEASEDSTVFPDELTAGWRKVATPRYGENPHQKGAVYSDPGETGGVANARRLHGIEMSYLNYFDADAAWAAANSFAEQTVAIVKHANPCGLATHPDQAEAYRRALEGDPVSAYGGIVGLNRVVTADTAEAMKGVLFDVIAAPGYEPEALEVLQGRRRTRVLQVAPATTSGKPVVRSIAGGALLQTPDESQDDPSGWSFVTERQPTEEEMADLQFAWQAVRFIRSNAIVIARDRMLAGMGAGQPNRVVSVSLAARAAGDRATGAALASDAFFPFPDGVEQAAEAGVTAVAQPGGSIRDEEVISAADRLGVAMVFTGARHFLH